MTEISKFDDTIDSRDVIERIAELESTINDGRDAAGENWDTDESTHTDGMSREQFMAEYVEINLSDEVEELNALLAFEREAEGYSEDWRHGATLIRDSYFKDYAQELAEDIGAVKSDATWPNNCIDWDQAARELQMDYTSVDFDGVTYWVR